MLRKYLTNVLFDFIVILIFLIILAIGKGAIDLFSSGHIYLWRYAKLIIQNTVGATGFLALLDLIDMAWKQYRKGDLK